MTQDELNKQGYELATAFCKKWPEAVYNPKDLELFFERGFQACASITMSEIERYKNIAALRSIEIIQLEKENAELRDSIQVLAEKKREHIRRFDTIQSQAAIIEKLIQHINERWVIDGAGFDINSEPIETLRDCMIAGDEQGRMLLTEISKMRGDM